MLRTKKQLAKAHQILGINSFAEEDSMNFIWLMRKVRFTSESIALHLFLLFKVFRT